MAPTTQKQEKSMLLHKNHITALVWSTNKKAIIIQYNKNNSIDIIYGQSYETYLETLEIVKHIPNFDAATHILDLNINNKKHTTITKQTLAYQ